MDKVRLRAPGISIGIASFEAGDQTGWVDSRFRISISNTTTMGSSTSKLNRDSDLATEKNDSANVFELAAQFGLTETLEQLVTETERLFSGEVRVEVVRDAELPALLSFVFGITAVGGMREILDCYTEWHRMSLRIAGEQADLFTLSVEDAIHGSE